MSWRFHTGFELMEKKAKKIILLGATGTIGIQTLEYVEQANREAPGSFEIVGMCAHSNEKKLLEYARFGTAAKLALAEKSETGRIHFSGKDAIRFLLENTEADIVVNGIAGSAGLEASWHALRSGKHLALANKESVVMGYRLLAQLANANDRMIIPVDSEHSALFQLIARIGRSDIASIGITASGGPFLNKSLRELETITPDEAVRHPVWNMGRKISIDSATLANKGLELIEAVRLFGFRQDNVRVLIHPQSLVHAFIQTRDSVLWPHVSFPDMRLPIAIALTWPEKTDLSYGNVDLAGKTLSFENPDDSRFPMLKLARNALDIGEGGTIAYNAADEVAVHAFEAGLIRFTHISVVTERVLSASWPRLVDNFEHIREIDSHARETAKQFIQEIEC